MTILDRRAFLSETPCVATRYGKDRLSLRKPGPAAPVCYFAVTKLQQRRLREGKVYLGHSVRTQSIIQRQQMWQQELEAGVTPFPQPESREGWIMVGNTDTHIQAGLPPSANLIYIIPHRCAQSCASPVTLDPVKLQL